MKDLFPFAIHSRLLNRIGRTLQFNTYPRPFEFRALCTHHNIGVEIGVLAGEHAKSIFKHAPRVEFLYLVDPYISYCDFSQMALERAHTLAFRNLNGFKHKFIKECSVKASTIINSNELDFVYIDGAHDYSSVKQDIETWYPKIKKGGIIGGHDFFNAQDHDHDGVVQAVAEFAVNNKLQLYVQDPDWWIVK